MQRDQNGVTNTVLNTPYKWNPGVSSQIPVANQSIDLGRRMSNATTGMGFKLDEDFVSGNAPVVIKLTYLDNNTDAWTLTYRNTSGTPVILSPSNGNDNSGDVRTSSFAIANFRAVPGAATNFELKGSLLTPFMFARVILT